MTGDRYTIRRGDLVRLNRPRRCMSRAVKTCFKLTRRRMANGYFRRLAEGALAELIQGELKP